MFCLALPPHILFFFWPSGVILGTLNHVFPGVQNLHISEFHNFQWHPLRGFPWGFVWPYWADFFCKLCQFDSAASTSKWSMSQTKPICPRNGGVNWHLFWGQNGTIEATPMDPNGLPVVVRSYQEPMDRLKCLREAVSMYCRAGELLTRNVPWSDMAAPGRWTRQEVFAKVEKIDWR